MASNVWAAVWRRGAHLSGRQRALPLDDMPAPRGLPLVGTSLSLLWAGSAPKLHLYVDKRHKDLGPIFRDRIGPVDAVFVADPAEMRRTFGLEGKYPIHILPEPWILYNKLYGCKRGLFFMSVSDERPRWFAGVSNRSERLPFHPECSL